MVQILADVEFGAELPEIVPDTSLRAARQFAQAIGYSGGGRFEDHEKARAEGLPGALVPGVMGMGFLVRMIHAWAPRGKIEHIDTVFRAPVLADHRHVVHAVVTEIDEEQGQVMLDLSIRNEKDETRVFGTATVAIPGE
jgi:hypothetical protein|tara:strand:- start:4995 stop:5411 length:417 start_codon:yes stop_codon:yes gene_type:complete